MPHTLSIYLCRAQWGGCELQTMAAIMGGWAAQEAIKLITEQYVPMKKLFIYNGMDCTAYEQ
jgi:NEDD8-activating enzyme E1 regulatory subunit